jgi:ABC-type dipeptide/oligopeptide/nickel transport system permease component
MLRFLFQRLLFILVVSLCIIYAAQLGVLWVVHSSEFIQEQTVAQLMATAAQNSLDFIGRIAHLDFGSYIAIGGARPVGELLLQALPASLGLLFISMLVSLGIGIPLGVWVALRRRNGLTFGVLATTLLGISVPSFSLAMLLQQGAIWYFATFDRRILSVAGYGWDYRHLLLPVIVLSARPIAYLMRTAHIVFDRTLQEDYIRTAYSKGLDTRRVINVHAFRNVAVPLLTAVGVSFRFSLAVLPIVEYLFAWPGLGLRLLQGVSNSQANLAMTFALVLGLLLMIGNLILDIAFRLVDPRLREAT